MADNIQEILAVGLGVDSTEDGKLARIVIDGAKGERVHAIFPAGNLVGIAEGVLKVNSELIARGTGNSLTIPPVSPMFFAQIANDRKAILLTFGDDKVPHARAVIAAEHLVGFMEMLMNAAVNLNVEISQAVAAKGPQPFETAAFSAISVDAVETSPEDCILVIRTTNRKELRIGLSTQILQQTKALLAGLGTGAGRPKQ